MTTYSIVLFQSIGIADEYKILIYLYFLGMMADGFAFILADKIGRRPLMFTSSVLVAASLYTVGGLTGFADSTNPTVQKGTLAAIFVWFFVDVSSADFLTDRLTDEFAGRRLGWVCLGGSQESRSITECSNCLV